MATEKEIQQAAKIIRDAIPRKNHYEQPLWQGVVNLIEKSDFGKEDARVDIISPLPANTSTYDDVLSGGFDGVQIQMLRICETILGSIGGVTMIPYTSKTEARSMSFEFKANK